MRIAVIGGGIVGLAVARILRLTRPESDICLVEKEAGFGRHQSTHNSGVLHAGLYYKPGSLKARLAVSGIRQMIEFCEEHGVAHEVCGKLVVATTPAEVERLRKLHERGIQNGLTGLTWLEPEPMREVEPHVGGIGGLHVPQEGIVDYRGVCDALEKVNRSLGVRLFSSARVARIVPDGKGHVIICRNFEIRVDFIVNCAGLHSDRVAAAAGEARSTRIVPFRGEYYQLKLRAAPRAKPHLSGAGSGLPVSWRALYPHDSWRNRGGAECRLGLCAGGLHEVEHQPGRSGRRSVLSRFMEIHGTAPCDGLGRDQAFLQQAPLL